MFGKPRLSISFVIHIHSYAHRVIRQDDDDDVKRYYSYYLSFNATKVNYPF